MATETIADLDKTHIARLEALGHRHQALWRAFGESEDRDVKEMLMALIMEGADKYTDILRSNLPDDAARAAFDDALKEMEKEGGYHDY